MSALRKISLVVAALLLGGLTGTAMAADGGLTQPTHAKMSAPHR